jgi:hypothetical protein
MKSILSFQATAWLMQVGHHASERENSMIRPRFFFSVTKLCTWLVWSGTSSWCGMASPTRAP